MRKRWLAVVLVLLLAAILWFVWSRLDAPGGKEAGAGDGGRSAASLWASRAGLAQRELDDAFWDGKRRMFDNASPCLLQLCTDPFNYWWMAQAADTLLDGYGRTGEAAYLERLRELFEGVKARNAGQWTNGYYDDMEWMALAWLRAFDMTQDDTYKSAALELWADIRAGWNDELGGGIAWRKEQTDYKNTPANAPAAILAVRLYERFGGEDDLAWAKKIYDWETATLVDPDTGFVWDGINRTGDGAIDKAWQFSYDQGVYIGAAAELFRATGESRYRDDARRTAKTAFATLAGEDGLLPNEGDGDAALFKGIFVRYLGEWIEQDDGPDRERWASMLQANAESLWNQTGLADDSGGPGGHQGDHAVEGSRAARFGPSWTQPPEAVVQLGAQLSAAMLLERMAALEKAGLLNKDGQS